MLDVTALSDDEGAEAAVQPTAGSDALVVCRTEPSRKRKLSYQELALVVRDVARCLRTTVNSNCPCSLKVKAKLKRNCFDAFRQPDVFGKVLELRKSLRTMCKEDSDRTVT